MFFDQHAFDVRCEWGAAGLRQLLANNNAMVIVDVLSFSIRTVSYGKAMLRQKTYASVPLPDRRQNSSRDTYCLPSRCWVKRSASSTPVTGGLRARRLFWTSSRRAEKFGWVLKNA